MNIRFLLRLLALSCFLIIGVTPARAQQQEEILSFRTQLIVAADGDLTVEERIEVRALNQEIRHGIYRDFPTEYGDRLGRFYKIHFELLSAALDGQAAHTSTESVRNGSVRGVRIKIGDKDRFVPVGVHVYTLRYRVDRELGFFPSHDELYWNVTGNGWVFPIRTVEASVVLPREIPSDRIRVAAYTGPEGSKEQAFRSGPGTGGELRISATRPLAAHEGLTIVVEWPKGFVAEPDARKYLEYFFRDSLALLVAAAGLLMVLLYYALVWNSVGRDPSPGTIIPLFDAPKGWSPADVGFVRRMGYGNELFSATVIDMAVRGYLKILADGSSYALKRTGADDKVLSEDQREIAKALFFLGDAVEMKNVNYARFGAALKALKERLTARHVGVHFVTNGKYLWPGAILSVLTVLATLRFVAPEQAAVSAFMSLWLSIWSLGVGALAVAVIAAWSAVLKGRKSSAVGTAAGTGAALFLTLFSLPFFGGEIFGLYMLYSQGSFATLAALVLALAVNILFGVLLKAPTVEGRRVLDQIEGFRMYLRTGERERLAAKFPPAKTPELFEKCLPYALVLGVHNEWAAQFASGVAGMSAAPASGASYTPAWYSGPAFGNFGAFSSGLASGFSSALSSSCSAPGSHSGGGGGGSSGGGGGGGGGGGW